MGRMSKVTSSSKAPARKGKVQMAPAKAASVKPKAAIGKGRK